MPTFIAMYLVRYGGQKPMKMLDLSWCFDRLTHPTGIEFYRDVSGALRRSETYENA
jgi:hypothetical protein